MFGLKRLASIRMREKTMMDGHPAFTDFVRAISLRIAHRRPVADAITEFLREGARIIGEEIDDIAIRIAASILGGFRQGAFPEDDSGFDSALKEFVGKTIVVVKSRLMKRYGTAREKLGPAGFEFESLRMEITKLLERLIPRILERQTIA